MKNSVSFRSEMRKVKRARSVTTVTPSKGFQREYDTARARKILGEERYLKVASILDFPPAAQQKDFLNVDETDISEPRTALKTPLSAFLLPEQKILHAKKRRCTLIVHSVPTNQEPFPLIGRRKSNQMIPSKVSKSASGSDFLFPPTPRFTNMKTYPRNLTNPYLRFIRQSPEKANIWKPPEVITEQAVLKMPLMERGLYVSNLIASKFCAWLKSLGTDNSMSSINESVLKELFEIQLENPTSTGIETRIKELPFLPDVISDVEMMPQRSFRALQRLNVLRDKKAREKYLKKENISAKKQGIKKKSKSKVEEIYDSTRGNVPEAVSKFQYRFFKDSYSVLEGDS